MLQDGFGNFSNRFGYRTQQQTLETIEIQSRKIPVVLLFWVYIGSENPLLLLLLLLLYGTLGNFMGQR